ncbi:MAG TPA: protein-disulfide reductase DsbD family protein, partial [Usitatibacteraceae bacterium]|nr:protein-disulfide reductase DsbD family protein [Usitatibacteraceae bacterium]
MARSLLAAASLLLAFAVQAAPVRTEHVEAELLAEAAAAAPGKPATVGLRLRMDKDWHTYWRNPGDSGLPTKIRWTLPEGWQAGPIQWPYPEAQRVGPLMNYGYSGEAMLLVELTPPADAKPGPVTIKADADWLVCKDICIPEKATLTLPFAVEGGSPPAASGNASLFAEARTKLPVAVAGWTAESAMAGSKLTLRVVPPAGGVAPAKVMFFPFRENFVD